MPLLHRLAMTYARIGGGRLTIFTRVSLMQLQHFPMMLEWIHTLAYPASSTVNACLVPSLATTSKVFE